MINCLMITTNRPDRLYMTMQALETVSYHGAHLGKKVLSIDLLPECIPGCEETLIPAAEHLGWKVKTGNCTGQRAMVNNIWRGLYELSDGGDYVFYCEDHVRIQDIPDEVELEYLRSHGSVEWICYNTHVHQENLMNVPGFIERPDRDVRLSFINDPAHWVRTPGGHEFLVKEEPIYDEYLLNFPAAITHVSTFRRLLQYACDNYKGIGIEIGFTKAWMDMGMPRYWNPAIFAEAGTVAALPLPNFHALHMRARMRFRNNDPSMLHPSIIPHQSLPADVKMQRSFF